MQQPVVAGADRVDRPGLLVAEAGEVVMVVGEAAVVEPAVGVGVVVVVGAAVEHPCPGVPCFSLAMLRKREVPRNRVVLVESSHLVDVGEAPAVVVGGGLEFSKPV